jgi:integrase
VLHDTKNKERRVLPLAHHALELIVARHQSRDTVTDLVFPSPYDPTRHWESQAAWKAAVDKAGLKDFRFHDLRHSAASYPIAIAPGLPMLHSAIRYVLRPFSGTAGR